MEYEYDCMRDSSRRWKNNGFSHIAYYHIPEHFTSEGKKLKKNNLQVHFFQKKCFWLYAMVFLVYDDFRGVRGSVRMYVECDGVLWSAMTPPECDVT